MDQFKAIESVRMSVQHTKRKKEMGEKIDPGRARLGKKIDQLVVYTSLIISYNYFSDLEPSKYLLSIVNYNKTNTTVQPPDSKCSR